jgi:hypothetical protein
MFMHRRQRAESQGRADLLEGRRVAVALHEFSDEVVNLTLPLGQSHGRPFLYPKEFPLVWRMKSEVSMGAKGRCPGRHPLLPHFPGQRNVRQPAMQLKIASNHG